MNTAGEALEKFVEHDPTAKYCWVVIVVAAVYFTVRILL